MVIFLRDEKNRFGLLFTFFEMTLKYSLTWHLISRNPVKLMEEYK